MNQGDDKQMEAAATEKMDDTKWYHINRNFLAIKIVIFWTFAGELTWFHFAESVYYYIYVVMAHNVDIIPLN